MNILHVVSSYPPAYDYGGPPRSVHNMAKALAERGHEVSVFTTDAKSADERVTGYENPEQREGVDVFRFRNVSNVLSWRNLPFAPGMWRTLSQRIGDFDVVHSHEFRSFHTWFAHRSATASHVPHVLQPRGSVPRRRKSLQKLLFDVAIGEILLVEADLIVASSSSEASQFEEVYPVETERVARVPNGINLEDFTTDLPGDGSFREEYGIDSDSQLVLFLSRLQERKGADLLVSAFASVRETYPEAVLALVGPDEGHREALAQQVNDAHLEGVTLFTGPLYGADKLAAYRDADVFVLPSKDRYESFGNVVLEALACGTPVVVTDVCGVSQWIPDPFAEVVTPDSSAIAAGINKTIEHGDVRRDEMQTFLQSELGWREVARRTESVYRKVTDGDSK